MEKSIYDQLGGFSNVRKIVIEFYNRVLDEEELSPYFAETNMERMIDHQTKFISMILGGPASFSDTHLKNVHINLSITNDHFELIKEVIIETLEDFDLDEEHVGYVSDEFEKRRNLIVTN
jgi:hemoglobin